MERLINKIANLPGKAHKALAWFCGIALGCFIAYAIYNAAANGLPESTGRLFFRALLLQLFKF